MPSWPHGSESTVLPFGGSPNTGLPSVVPPPSGPSAPSATCQSPSTIAMTTTASASNKPQTIATPRTPGVVQPARLPPAARQEYDSYMQDRLRQMNQQQQQQHQQQGPRATLVQGVSCLCFCLLMQVA